MVSCLIFRSLNHFEFIFAYEVRECSNLIDLHEAVQLSQHHLMKRPSSPLYVLASFVKNKLTISVWVYFWTLYSVPLSYMSVFVPRPHCFDYCNFVVILKCGRVMPPALLFFPRIALAIMGLL